MKGIVLIFISIALVFVSCSGGNSQKKTMSAQNNKIIRLVTVDPGHFHAALVQKSMYDQVSPDVYVYAPGGSDLEQHLARINSYNTRSAEPTSWNEKVYRGPDFFEKMISEKPGNVVVLSGNNSKKAFYISKSVNAGLNVLADKPMIINPADLPELENAFRTAGEKGLILYDIMTERYEITTILQRELSMQEDIFGKLLTGTENEPAVTKESVHHFAKIVSGISLIRPSWFFDTEQQGEGLVDVTTHLVDLVQWECFPEQILTNSDIEMVKAKRWSSPVSKEEFGGVTGMNGFPDFLMKDVRNGKLELFSNGEMTYRIKGVWAKVSVEWRYMAPAGGGDTHFSIMRGSKCDLVIRQTADEKFIPVLYIENIKGEGIDDFTKRLGLILGEMPYDSLGFEKLNDKVIKINIPSKYRVGHEDHFAQVTSKFLGYLKEGKLPEWEVAGMKVKYFTTMSALKKALGN